MTRPQVRTRHLLTLSVHLDDPQFMAPTPSGTRKVVTVRDGHFSGDLLRGRVLPGGSDWALTRADGALLLDVRLVLETDDGSRLCMTYTGIRHGPRAAMERLAAGERVDPHDYYFRVAPRFETADARYDWLNRALCIGLGDRSDVGPRYDVFEVL
jgi:hypothetical protein